MHDVYPLLEHSDFPFIKRGSLTTVQVNLGYKCNQSCTHCHVNAGPKRKEEMSKPVMIDILKFGPLGVFYPAQCNNYYLGRSFL